MSAFKVRFRYDVDKTALGGRHYVKGEVVVATDILFEEGKRVKECFIQLEDRCMVLLDALTLVEGDDAVLKMLNSRLMRRLRLTANKIEFMRRAIDSGSASTALESMGGFRAAHAGKWKPLGEPSTALNSKEGDGA